MTAPIGFGAYLQRNQLPALENRAPRTSGAEQVTGERGVGATSEPQGPSFGQQLQNALDSVNHVQVEGMRASESFADGTQQDIHGTMLALEKADITLRFVSNVRNRVIEAYREIMKMGA